jgi:hypothetical protein
VLKSFKEIERLHLLYTERDILHSIKVLLDEVVNKGAEEQTEKAKAYFRNGRYAKLMTIIYYYSSSHHYIFYRS